MKEKRKVKLNKVILRKTKEFVGQMFRNNGTNNKYFHNFTHTAEVVKVIDEIASALNINDEDREILSLAGWFHDVGYTECFDGHEDLGIEIASNFLNSNDYPEAKVIKVAALIRATQMPRKPKNLLEEIICDADLHHLGIEEFSEKEKLFRNEVEKIKGHKINNEVWLKGNLDFMKNHKFFTKYAREKFGPQKNKNLNKVLKKLKKVEQDN